MSRLLLYLFFKYFCRELELWFPTCKFSSNGASAAAEGGGAPATVGPGDPEYDELMSYMKEKVSFTELSLARAFCLRIPSKFFVYFMAMIAFCHLATITALRQGGHVTGHFFHLGRLRATLGPVATKIYCAPFVAARSTVLLSFVCFF